MHTCKHSLYQYQFLSSFLNKQNYTQTHVILASASLVVLTVHCDHPTDAAATHYTTVVYKWHTHTHTTLHYIPVRTGWPPQTDHPPFYLSLYWGPYLQKNKCTWLEKSVLVGTAIKNNETSSWDETQTECMHFNPYFSCTVYSIEVGIKCLHSVRVSSQLLVSVLFIAIPTNTENFNFSYTSCVLFLASMQRTHNRKHAIFILHRQDNSMAMIWWLDYIKCNLLLFV